MEVYSLETVADLLGKSVITVRRMVKRGDLKAVFIKTGGKGRPTTMITVSSYGRYLLNNRKAGR